MNSENKTGKIISYIFVFIITAMMFAGTIFFFILPKEEFSENENRALEKMPKYSFSSLKNGEYLEHLETYMNEHFPARDFFMGLKTNFEKGIGRFEINNIYVSKDGYYIEKYDEPQNTDKTIAVFSKFCDKIKDARVTMMLVPTAVTIYDDKLPNYAVNGNQLEDIDKIYSGVNCEKIYLADALRNRKDNYQLYYRYDHHWTSFGAYTAYEEYCKQSGLECASLNDRETEVVSENFKGTIYSKVNDYLVSGDDITIFKQPDVKWNVEYDGKKENASDTLYNWDYLSKKDQYSFFLDNIHSIIKITNDNAKTDRELVVVKDSYANCLVPLLTEQYKVVYVYDTRYYKRPISMEINANKSITDILILYNLNTLDTDLGVGGIY